MEYLTELMLFKRNAVLSILLKARSFAGALIHTILNRKVIFETTTPNLSRVSLIFYNECKSWFKVF